MSTKMKAAQIGARLWMEKVLSEEVDTTKASAIAMCASTKFLTQKRQPCSST